MAAADQLALGAQSRVVRDWGTGKTGHGLSWLATMARKIRRYLLDAWGLLLALILQSEKRRSKDEIAVERGRGNSDFFG